jgi:hypothetical protein
MGERSVILSSRDDAYEETEMAFPTCFGAVTERYKFRPLLVIKWHIDLHAFGYLFDEIGTNFFI